MAGTRKSSGQGKAAKRGGAAGAGEAGAGEAGAMAADEATGAGAAGATAAGDSGAAGDGAGDGGAANAASAENGMPAAVAIAWGIHSSPQRGPSRGLTHAQIVAAAAELADAQGLGAVTMQAVAKSLGFTTMSLYRYISGKNDLLRLMQDHAFAFPAHHELPTDWQSALREWAKLVRSLYRSRPWALRIPRDQTSVLMPNSVRGADLGLRALAGLAVPDEVKVAVILTVSQNASAFTELEFSLSSEGGMSVTEEGAQQLGEIITPEAFPGLGPLMQSGLFVPTTAESSSHPESRTDGAGEADVDEDFDFALDLIIAGLERMEERAARPGEPGQDER